MQITRFNTLHLLKTSSSLRYLAVSVGNNNVTHSEAQAVCEQIAEGLATVLTDADFVAANTTVHHSGVLNNCMKARMWMGATGSGILNWQWRTGEPLPINWPYWGLNKPDKTTSACMRAQMATGVLVSTIVETKSLTVDFLMLKEYWLLN